jgi:hypothetical protein
VECVRIVGVLALVVTALSVAAGSTDAGVVAGTSGLRGVLLRAPVTPVCVEEEPCSEPAVGVILVFARDGRTWRTRTRAGGAYAIWLRPGWYAVRALPTPRVGSGLTPRRVRVPAGRVATRDFLLDTGLQ